MLNVNTYLYLIIDFDQKKNSSVIGFVNCKPLIGCIRPFSTCRWLVVTIGKNGNQKMYVIFCLNKISVNMPHASYHGTDAPDRKIDTSFIFSNNNTSRSVVSRKNHVFGVAPLFVRNAANWVISHKCC